MQLGFIGLGRMGGNMVHRIHRDSDHQVVAFDRSPDAVREAESHGATAASSLEELLQGLEAPRHVWVMVPAGDATRQTIDALVDLLEDGDAIVDGGNSRWTDSRDTGARLAKRGIEFVDVGTSGGVWGLEVGYCMMVGGSEGAVGRLAPILDVLAPPDGWGHMGPSGAGHYVKMAHNGVEYGMMQAYAEGFEILQKSRYDYDLRAICSLWNQGSVVRSWLLELAERAFEKDANLDSIRGYVEDSGEGRWTVLEAIQEDVPANVIAGSLFARFASRQDDAFALKVLAALRGEFGGHAIKEAATESEK
jgi:6-phosphogluconate dehydrogenase